MLTDSDLEQIEKLLDRKLKPLEKRLDDKIEAKYKALYDLIHNYLLNDDQRNKVAGVTIHTGGSELRIE